MNNRLSLDTFDIVFKGLINPSMRYDCAVANVFYKSLCILYTGKLTFSSTICNELNPYYIPSSS